MSEQDRVDAEEGRVAAEHIRDSNETGNSEPLESGRIGSEAGRVTAEEDRVIAEEKRETHGRRRERLLRSIVYGVFVLFALATLAGFLALYRTETLVHDRVKERVRVTTKICQGQNQIRATLRQLISVGDRTLDTLAYYKDHPEELTRAHNANLESLEALHTLNCTKLDK